MWVGEDIKTMTRGEQISFLKKRWSAIHFIDEPDIELQMTAIEADPQALSCIKNPSYRIMICAINKDPMSILLVKDAPRELVKYAIEKHPSMVLQMRMKLDQELAELALGFDFNLHNLLQAHVSPEAHVEAEKKAREYWAAKDKDEKFIIIMVKEANLDLISIDDIRNRVDVSDFYEVLYEEHPINTTINDLLYN